MKGILVKEFYRLHGKASTTVPEGAALDYVIALLGHERHLQAVFVVNENQKYAGMVSRFDLMKWTRLQLYGGKQKTDMQISELSRLVKARKAKDLETHNTSSFYVKENDTLLSALDLMIEFEQDIIPVLDGEGKILGDLSLSEVLSNALEVGMPSHE